MLTVVADRVNYFMQKSTINNRQIEIQFFLNYQRKNIQRSNVKMAQARHNSHKKILFLACFLLITALLASCSTTRPEGHLVVTCRIYDKNGKIVRTILDGRGVCFLNDDGSVLYSNWSSELIFYDKNFNQIWKKKAIAHHQINKTSNGDYLLLFSENHLVNGKLVRFDKIVRIDPRGNIVGEFNIFKNFEKIEQKITQTLIESESFSSYSLAALHRMYNRKNAFRILTEQDKVAYNNAEIEYFHVNSIYEIDKNKNKSKELAPGNIIVNFTIKGVALIFNSELSEIVKVIIAPSFFTHDLHLTPEGDLFVYNNFANYQRVSNLKEKNFSAVQIYEYPSMNLKFSFGDKMIDRFHSRAYGGGQVLENGEVVFSDINDEVASISLVGKDGSLIKKFRIGELETLGSFQQVKFRDMSNFLKNNQWDKF